MECNICGQKTQEIFKAKVMGKYAIKYYHCSHCQFTETERPHYWLKEAYDSPMNLTDTGILERNLYFSYKMSALIHNFFDINGKYLDYSGGYGVLTRLMRDYGYDFYWNDPYTKNLLARGFEYDSKKHKKIELLTTFEVFEHLVEPIKEIKEMLKVSDTVVFSTQLVPDPIPAPTDWWYYGLEHGQHTSLYKLETLKYIAEELGLYVYSHNEFHMFTKRKLWPKIISKKLLDHAKSTVSGEYRRKLSDLYKPVKPNTNSQKHKLVMDVLYRLRFGRFYMLRPNVDTTELSELWEALSESGFISKQYEYLSANGERYHNLFAVKEVFSKTYDDMLSMKELLVEHYQKKPSQ